MFSRTTYQNLHEVVLVSLTSSGSPNWVVVWYCSPVNYELRIEFTCLVVLLKLQKFASMINANLCRNRLVTGPADVCVVPLSMLAALNSNTLNYGRQSVY